MTLLKPRHLLLFSLLSLVVPCCGQNFISPNEVVIYSFKTQNGKEVKLIKDTANKYIIYRFSNKSNIEFEFPTKSKNSWTNFKYSFYLRGGGTQNEGMDLNYVYFTNKGFMYVLYDTYFSTLNKQSVGIKVINLNTRKSKIIRGNKETQTGTLISFRDNHLLTIGEELFD